MWNNFDFNFWIFARSHISIGQPLSVTSRGRDTIFEVRTVRVGDLWRHDQLAECTGASTVSMQSIVEYCYRNTDLMTN